VAKVAGASPLVRAFVERRQLFRSLDHLAADARDSLQSEIFRLIRRCEDVIGDTRAATTEEALVQLLLAAEDISYLRNTEPSEDDSLYLSRVLRCIFSALRTLEQRSRLSVSSLTPDQLLGPDPFTENEDLRRLG
jgi:hypothetical protein